MEPRRGGGHAGRDAQPRAQTDCRWAMRTSACLRLNAASAKRYQSFERVGGVPCTLHTRIHAALSMIDLCLMPWAHRRNPGTGPFAMTGTAGGASPKLGRRRVEFGRNRAETGRPSLNSDLTCPKVGTNSTQGGHFARDPGSTSCTKVARNRPKWPPSSAELGKMWAGVDQKPGPMLTKIVRIRPNSTGIGRGTFEKGPEPTPQSWPPLAPNLHSRSRAWAVMCAQGLMPVDRLKCRC